MIFLRMRSERLSVLGGLRPGLNKSDRAARTILRRVTGLDKVLNSSLGLVCNIIDFEEIN